jgi:hypothetical protein
MTEKPFSAQTRSLMRRRANADPLKFRNFFLQSSAVLFHAM